MGRNTPECFFMDQLTMQILGYNFSSDIQLFCRVLWFKVSRVENILRRLAFFQFVNNYINMCRGLILDDCSNMIGLFNKQREVLSLCRSCNFTSYFLVILIYR